MFSPELGQAAFSNTPWNELPMSASVESVLLAVGDILKGFGLVTENPCYNVGEEYEGVAFSMRSYCWCDGGGEKHWRTGEPYGHPDGCPPNFEWRDFRCAWYKHVGRGNSQNRDISADELAEMLGECLSEIRRARKEADRG